MKNKTMNFLTASIITVVIACIILFTALGIFMNRKSDDTLSEMGSIYMSGLNERISKHFETIIDMQFNSLQSIIDDINDEVVQDYVDKNASIGYICEARGFNYLALYDHEGNFDMLYGDQIELEDPESFMKSIRNGNKKIAAGRTEDGSRIVIVGIPAPYTIVKSDVVHSDIEKSLAMVAAFPSEYIETLLALDEESAIVYSHVIRKDGSFVIRSSDAFRENYFDRIRALSDNNPEQAEYSIEELSRAMSNRSDFSSIFSMEDERRHIYCSSLPYSEWYLVTVMPYGIMDKTVSDFSNLWISMALLSCLLILGMLMIVFVKYYRMTEQQIHDINNAREAAERATKAKSEFLSNMSHDIRTPMNAIVGMTAIAISNIDRKDQVANCLKKIALSSKHLLGLINDILDMSKIESGKLTLNMEQISLREITDSIVNIVQPQVKAKKQEFDVFINGIDAEEVYCDSVRFNQVLLNLLSNAIKFTPDGGKIELTLNEEDSPLGDEYIRVHIIVRDTGIGMSEEFKNIVFESFAREDSKRVHKTEGTGLGMAITKYIVDAMHGTIDVESEQGKGTKFHVTLDLEKADEREADMILPNWDMLVVDDDEMLCESAVHSLKTIGIDAEWTLDGETAVKMVTERHNSNKDYNVILLDWRLPGIDGIETAREIRKHTDIPILLISAYDWSEIEAEAREAGISGFIAKPLFKSTLYYGLKHIAASDGEAETETAAETVDESSALNGKRILLSEDNDLNWEIANELLSSQGLILEHAENGQVCLDMFKNSAVGYYDAVLMDLRMPVMNGYEAADAIRALDREDAGLPIIAMTADAFSEDKQKCLEHGMNAHVPKPIDVRDVMKLLEKHIENYSSGHKHG